MIPGRAFLVLAEDQFVELSGAMELTKMIPEEYVKEFANFCVKHHLSPLAIMELNTIVQGIASQAYSNGRKDREKPAGG